MFRQILGPSFPLYALKKIHSHLFFHGGETTDTYLPDEEFFEVMTSDKNCKARRLNNQEVTKMFAKKAKKLPKDQKLVKSIIEHAELSRVISEHDFKNLDEIYKLRRKYKNYLRVKRFIPLSIIGPFTGTELSKMAYAAALGSKSVSLTLPGIIGYSLPAFFFFHMSYYYAPDKFKPVCQACKYTLGAPFWIANSITDELMSTPEEKFFGEEVPIDVVNTGGTIPNEIGSIEDLRQLIEDLKDTTRDFTKKTY